MHNAGIYSLSSNYQLQVKKPGFCSTNPPGLQMKNLVSGLAVSLEEEKVMKARPMRHCTIQTNGYNQQNGAIGYTAITPDATPMAGRAKEPQFA